MNWKKQYIYKYAYIKKQYYEHFLKMFIVYYVLPNLNTFANRIIANVKNTHFYR